MNEGFRKYKTYEELPKQLAALLKIREPLNNDKFHTLESNGSKSSKLRLARGLYNVPKMSYNYI